MERQVLLDKLSEFLMVEQLGWQLYQVVAARATDPELRRHYEEFGRETSHHRAILLRLIGELGGDPEYVSPCARLAQLKAEMLANTALVVDGLSPDEVQANDLENVLIAETKDYADWNLLARLVEQVDEPAIQNALQRAVQEAGPQEEEHLRWAGGMLEELGVRLVSEGPAPDRSAWQSAVSAPLPPIEAIHPAPMPADGQLLPGATQPMWGAPPVARSLGAAGGGRA